MGRATLQTVDELPSSSRYAIVERIAKGGMGTVYLGVQRGAAGFHRPVAIKRTHRHLLEDERIREILIDEARNASAVRHPNVVSIDDVEEVDGELLLIMAYVPGGSLSQLLERDMPMGIALRVLLDAAAGIAAIHDAKDARGRALGLVHRDVSPQNILVGSDGVARIADFGIAKRISDPKRTAKMMRRGKHGYMAPEYVKTGETTASADMFALGVVMWEALTGRRLFRGASAVDTLRLTLEAKVPSVRTFAPAVTDALDRVVLRALAAKVEDRFPSMRALHDALELAAGGAVAPRSEVAAWTTATEPSGARPVELSADDLLSSSTVVEDLIELDTIDTPAGAPPPIPTARPPARAGRPAPMPSAVRERRAHRAFGDDAPRRRSSARRYAGLLLFAITLVGSTAALVYAGTHEAAKTTAGGAASPR